MFWKGGSWADINEFKRWHPLQKRLVECFRYFIGIRHPHDDIQWCKMYNYTNFFFTTKKYWKFATKCLFSKSRFLGGALPPSDDFFHYFRWCFKKSKQNFVRKHSHHILLRAGRFSQFFLKGTGFKEGKRIFGPPPWPHKYKSMIFTVFYLDSWCS